MAFKGYKYQTATFWRQLHRVGEEKGQEDRRTGFL